MNKQNDGPTKLLFGTDAKITINNNYLWINWEENYLSVYSVWDRKQLRCNKKLVFHRRKRCVFQPKPQLQRRPNQRSPEYYLLLLFAAAASNCIP